MNWLKQKMEDELEQLEIEEGISEADIDLYGRVFRWWKLARIGYLPKHLGLNELDLVAHVEWFVKQKETEMVEKQIQAFKI